MKQSSHLYQTQMYRQVKHTNRLTSCERYPHQEGHWYIISGLSYCRHFPSICEVFDQHVYDIISRRQEQRRVNRLFSSQNGHSILAALVHVTLNSPRALPETCQRLTPSGGRSADIAASSQLWGQVYGLWCCATNI